jgi:transcription initiation factor TFIIH subunit 3
VTKLRVVLVSARPLVVTMEKASHLSVIVDLSPTQWHLSAQATNPYPLPIETFLSHLLAFLNAHIASKHENTLAVFGALPGKRLVGQFPEPDCEFR